jgi:chorismate mutase/prephenate dehydratase
MSEPTRRDNALAAAEEPDPTRIEDELGALRVEIDHVDRAILERLNERARIVRRVGDLKRASARSVYRAGRERDLVAALVAENPGPFPRDALPAVFREIVSATRSLEATLRVAFLGPEGTFSHLAVQQTFGSQVSLVPCPTIADVFSAVERGDADHGIVPVENTTEGVVTQTLDGFVASDLPISGEALLPISHDLLGRAARLADVQRVASHPQPLAQCRTWLDRHLPRAERIEAASTAAAAELAVADDAIAAIGSRLLGELRSLDVLARAIEDRRDNTTRFLVIGAEAPEASGDDLTSVVFTVRKAEAGALYHLLAPFAEHGVNLTSIHSRPLKGAPWEYLFFVELEGHLRDAPVARALEAAGVRANSTRILGSFPRCTPGPGRRKAD